VGPPFQVAVAQTFFDLGAAPIGEGRFLITYDRPDPALGITLSHARFVSVSTTGVSLESETCARDPDCLENRCVSGACQRGGAVDAGPLDGGGDAGSLDGDAGALVNGGTDSGRDPEPARRFLVGCGCGNAELSVIALALVAAIRRRRCWRVD
jgi:hypothetical protein